MFRNRIVKCRRQSYELLYQSDRSILLLVERHTMRLLGEALSWLEKPHRYTLCAYQLRPQSEGDNLRALIPFHPQPRQTTQAAAPFDKLRFTRHQRVCCALPAPVLLTFHPYILEQRKWLNKCKFRLVIFNVFEIDNKSRL